MRALYLFINELASSTRTHATSAQPGNPRSTVDDGELAPIQRGAFARWAAARDTGQPATNGLGHGGAGVAEPDPVGTLADARP